MRLDRAGREYVRWPFTSDADPALSEVDVWLAGAWHDATIEAGEDGPEVVLLVAGPDADDEPSAVVLPLGGHAPRIRFPDNPEVLVETGGFIVVE
jgi:hypothetical protein